MSGGVGPGPRGHHGAQFTSLWLPLVPLSLAAVTVALTPTTVVTETPVIAAGSLLIAATLLRQLESAELVSRGTTGSQPADRLNGEPDSAFQYVASILPVRWTARCRCARGIFRPARWGGFFGYRWIDDDHLIVYPSTSPVTACVRLCFRSGAQSAAIGKPRE